MGCLQNSFEGRCNMFDPDIEMPGCSEEGYCICDTDPDPSILCEQYQSDWPCPTCGFDLNSGEDCGCEGERNYEE